jgi:hypothetical protein
VSAATYCGYCPHTLCLRYDDVLTEQTRSGRGELAVYANVIDCAMRPDTSRLSRP